MVLAGHGCQFKTPGRGAWSWDEVDVLPLPFEDLNSLCLLLESNFGRTTL